MAKEPDMGMDRDKLAARTKQPGDDQTYRKSEQSFADLLRRLLNPEVLVVREKPSDLRKMFPSDVEESARDEYGIVPEVAVTHKTTNQSLYFEVKKQEKGGNAEERACKHHTVQFKKRLGEFTGYPFHAYVTIFCEELANYPKYLAKHPYFFEPESYFCWKDYSDTAALAEFLERVIRKTILPDTTVQVLVAISDAKAAGAGADNAI
ncbi:MAG: hypothetical protein K2W85_07380 [Phycisphaerales bacterium]|nr:hypothetical protein [Phycisphaerales bacterium]